MRTLRHVSLSWLVALGASAGHIACSSDSNDHPPAIGSGGTSASAGSSANETAGDGGESSTAGAAGESIGEGGELAKGGNGGNAGAPMNAVGGGAIDSIPSDPTCSETAKWSDSTKLAGISADATQTLSLTPDELDLAFVQSGALYAAHRAQASGDFAVGAAIAIPSGWTATRGFALSSDGKRLVLVNEEQTALGELTRTARGAAFAGAIDESAFAIVNQATMYSGNVFSSPVISSDDEQLFLSSTAPGGASTVVAATRAHSGDVWSSATRLSADLDGQTGRRLPTGISADGRTLFYFNEDSQKEEARWRNQTVLSSPLYDMVDLGARRGAAPNSACNRLYSLSAGDVVSESD